MTVTGLVGHTLRTLVVYRRAAFVSLFATAAIALLVILAWPGDRLPLALLLAGPVCSCLAPVAVTTLLDRRHPCLQTRDHVERILGLPVLACVDEIRER